jgi:hypothetical protein
MRRPYSTLGNRVLVYNWTSSSSQEIFNPLLLLVWRVNVVLYEMILELGFGDAMDLVTLVLNLLHSL